MLSKNSIKYIKSLQLKKYRQEEKLFCVEGIKSVLEVLNSSYQVKLIAGTADFFSSYDPHLWNNVEMAEVGTKDLSKVSSFKNNTTVLAVVHMPENKDPQVKEEWSLVLDGISDPGNLGTMIRLADWYGVEKIICSEDTVELYNPKTIASSMGSFTRVKVFYTELSEYLRNSSLPKFGTFLHGEDVHACSFESRGLLIIGSESHGISPEVAKHIDHQITIPSYGNAESLNAAIASAVVFDNIRRVANK